MKTSGWRVLQFCTMVCASMVASTASSQYIYKIYFRKTVVGSTFVSAYVKDADGNTLWSG